MRFSRTQLESDMLASDQIAAFERDGFIAVHDVLSADELTALRERTHWIVTGEIPFPEQFIQIEPELEGTLSESRLNRVRKVWNLTQNDPVFREYAFHPK